MTTSTTSTTINHGPVVVSNDENSTSVTSDNIFGTNDDRAHSHGDHSVVIDPMYPGMSKTRTPDRRTPPDFDVWQTVHGDRRISNGSTSASLECLLKLETLSSLGSEYFAINSYVPELEDELAFAAGDRITVYCKDPQETGDVGWWAGRLGDKVGYLPSKYVVSGAQLSSKVHMVSYKELILDNVVGTGGFSKVYRGFYDNKEVAIKITNLNLNKTPEENIAIVRREANIASWFRHENICGMMAMCLEYPNLCLIMEYAQGGSLHRVLQTTNISISTVLAWMEQIARGVNYMHNEAGIEFIHGDLKSHNVLLKKPFAHESLNTLMITDFGTAQKIAKTTKMSKQTGTYEWMSPEAIKFSIYSKACDVWSYGVVMWEMLTGEIPFKGIPWPQICYGIVAGKLSLPIPATCPEDFAKLLSSCWSTDPKNRPTFRLILLKIQEIGENLELDNGALDSLRDSWKSEIHNIYKELSQVTTQLQRKEEELKEMQQLLNENEKRREKQFKLKEVALDQLLSETQSAHQELQDEITRAETSLDQRTERARRQLSAERQIAIEELERERQDVNELLRQSEKELADREMSLRVNEVIVLLQQQEKPEPHKRNRRRLNRGLLKLRSSGGKKISSPSDFRHTMSVKSIGNCSNIIHSSMDWSSPVRFQGGPLIPSSKSKSPIAGQTYFSSVSSSAPNLIDMATTPTYPYSEFFEPSPESDLGLDDHVPKLIDLQPINQETRKHDAISALLGMGSMLGGVAFGGDSRIYSPELNDNLHSREQCHRHVYILHNKSTAPETPNTTRTGFRYIPSVVNGDMRRQKSDEQPATQSFVRLKWENSSLPSETFVDRPVVDVSNSPAVPRRLTQTGALPQRQESLDSHLDQRGRTLSQPVSRARSLSNSRNIPNKHPWWKPFSFLRNK